MTFENLNIIDQDLKALRKEEYTTSTPMQRNAIPLILKRKTAKLQSAPVPLKNQSDSKDKS